MHQFERLSRREKIIVIVASVVLMLLSIHSFIWQPLVDEQAALIERKAEALDDLAWVKDNIAQLSNESKQGSTQKITGSLVSWLDLRIIQYQLKDQLKRIKPSSETQVKLWFEKANMANMTQFLGDMKPHQIKISSIKISASDDLGLVDAQVVLQAQ